MSHPVRIPRPGPAGADGLDAHRAPAVWGGMIRKPLIPPALGAGAVALLAILAAQTSAGDLAAGLSAQARQAIVEAGGDGVRAVFASRSGSPSRHPLLFGGEDMDAALRARTAQAIAAVPGVGGVHWEDSAGLAASKTQAPRPLHCQDDVEALLRARSIRFEESSARIEQASLELVDEVAQALRPCLGSIIAITGHTDSSGPEPGNLALSRERADAVKQALIERGIPSDGLRAAGVGSAHPVMGLDSADTANRRIEFSVIATVPIKPTPVDTPGAQ